MVDRILKKKIHFPFFHYVIKMAMPLPPPPHEIDNFWGLLPRYYFIISLSALCLGIEKEIFKDF